MNDFSEFRIWAWERLRNATGLAVFHDVVPESARFPFVRFSVPALREWPSFWARSGVQTGLMTVDIFSSKDTSVEAEALLHQAISALDRQTFQTSENRYWLGLTNVRLRWEDNGRYWLASADFSLHRFMVY